MPGPPTAASAPRAHVGRGDGELDVGAAVEASEAHVVVSGEQGLPVGVGRVKGEAGVGPVQPRVVQVWPGDPGLGLPGTSRAGTPAKNANASTCARPPVGLRRRVPRAAPRNLAAVASNFWAAGYRTIVAGSFLGSLAEFLAFRPMVPAEHVA